MYLGKFTYRDGGLVRMDPGGPVNPNFKSSYDWRKSPEENAELNKRAEAAGHNSVAEYEKSGWAWQPKQAQAAQPKQQQPASFYENPKGNTLENSGYPYQSDGSQANKTWAEKVVYQPRTEFEQKKAAAQAAEQERLGRERWEQQRRSPAYTDHAGLPSVPIFESLLMAPVALGEAGLTGLVRAAPAVGSAIWEGAGSLGSTIGTELSSLGSSIYEGGTALAGEIGEGFNAVKQFAKPAVDAWNSTLGTRLFGAAEMGASPAMQTVANLMTPANLLKTWGLYDASTKYAPEAIESGQMYNQTGDTKYLKDIVYNTGKAALEFGSHTGPLVHEVQAVKRPVSFVDDAIKMADANRDVTDRGISSFKTIKNTMGILKKEGGNTYGKLPKAKEGDELDWEAVKNPELAAKAKAMGHNTIAEYRNSNWGYGNFGFNENKKQPPATNTPPIPRITDPAEQEKIDYLQAKNKLKLRQQLESAQARNADIPNIIEVAKNRNKGMDAIKEMHQKYPDDKRLSVKEDRAMEETGDFLMQQAAQKLVPKPIGTAQDIISFPDQLQQWAAAQKEAEGQYGNYTDELQHKVDTYEKAQGTYQPGLFNELRTQMKMPMAPSSLSFAYGGDIAVPNLKRVKIKSLPKNWKSQ